jgi:hypothetical protein
LRLRLTVRQLLGLLFQFPPRTTRSLCNPVPYENDTIENRLNEHLGVAVPDMTYPTPNPLPYLRGRHLPGLILSLEPTEPPCHAADALPLQPSPTWPNPEPEKFDSFIRSKDPALAFMYLQTVIGQKSPDLLTGGPQLGLVVAKDGKVVHVTHIPMRPECFFHVVVKGIQVYVGKQLACQVADGKPLPSLQGGEEVVAHKVPRHRYGWTAMVNDLLRQPQGVFASHNTAHFLLENLVVYARKILSNVAHQHISVGLSKSLKPVHGAVSPFADPVGPCVVYKPPLP